MTRPKPKRRQGIRRWFQFSLRRLLVLVAVAAVVASYLARPERLEETAPDGAHKIVREIFRNRDGEPVNHGVWILYDGDEHKLIEGHYRNGKSQGQWTYWHPRPSGRRAMMGACQDGRRKGRWTAWYPTGRKRSAIDYVDGRPHGLATRWRPDGVIEERGWYKDGVREGAWTIYDGQGRHLARGEYVGGRRHGEWMVWNAGGKEFSTLRFTAGKRDSDDSDVIAVWKKKLLAGDPKEQSYAAWALANLGPAAEGAVAEALQSTRVDVRCRALMIAARRPVPLQWLPLLLRALDDADPSVRLAAIGALTPLGPAAKSAIPSLERMLSQAGHLQRPYLHLALISIDPGRTEDLKELLSNKLPWTPTLPERSDSERDSFGGDPVDSFIGPYRSIGLGSMSTISRHLAPGLLRSLEDDDAALRAKAALALAWIDPPPAEAVPAIVKRLDDPNAIVRHHACYALQYFGPLAITAASRLKQLAEGADESLAKSAQAALDCTIGKPYEQLFPTGYQDQGPFNSLGQGFGFPSSGFGAGSGSGGGFFSTPSNSNGPLMRVDKKPRCDE